ncbi:MAG: hypothetical protein Q7V01_07195 [Vicinamibacterales bacterium]|nr:hypothetical protein [Vicinamibacterales bacterium]
MAPDAAAGRARRARWRWGVLTVLVAFAVWHAIFDITIDRGMRAYVDGQARHARGEGPSLDIRESMADARSRGAQQGLAGAGVVVVLSAGLSRLRRRYARPYVAPGL